MRFRSFISLLLVLILFHFTIGESQSVSSESLSLNDFWTHKIYLDRNVTVSWNSSDSEWLEMEMSAPVKGYVAIGFSPNGQMRGSDIVLGWVDTNGVPYLLVSVESSKTQIELIFLLRARIYLFITK